MSMSHRLSKFVAPRFALAVVLGMLFFWFGAAGTSASRFAFIDSVGKFLGFQSKQTSAVQSDESNSEPVIEPTILSSPSLFATGTTSATPLSGTYSVGLGRAYGTLTAAVADYVSRGVNGSVVFSLTDATYPAETYPIVIGRAIPVGGLTIKPA